MLEVGALSLVSLALGSCYMVRRPDPFEAVALSATVVGMVLSLMSQYTLMPIAAGLGLVGIARLVDHVKLSRRGVHISLARKRNSP